LGQLGTIKASSLQTYISAVNGFFKDHGLEPIALGDLVAEVRKGLAALHVAIDDAPVRVHLPASIVVKALRMTQALRFQLIEATSRETLKPTKHEIKYGYYGHVVFWYYSSYSSVAGARAWSA
jgi:hypothetical protein